MVERGGWHQRNGGYGRECGWEIRRGGRSGGAVNGEDEILSEFDKGFGINDNNVSFVAVKFEEIGMHSCFYFSGAVGECCRVHNCRAKRDGQVLRSHPTNPNANCSQQGVKFGTGQLQVALEMVNSPALTLKQLWRSYTGWGT